MAGRIRAGEPVYRNQQLGPAFRRGPTNLVFTSVDEFVRSLGGYPSRVVQARGTAVRAAALAAKTSILPHISRGSGGDLRLSGVGRSGANVGVRYDVKGYIVPTALVRATGPLHLIERDTAPHRIPKRPPLNRPLRINGRIVRGPVMHPGTQGKHVWAAGVRAALPAIRAAFRGAFRREVLGF